MEQATNNCQQTNIFCPFCGTKLSSESAFCLNCGQKIPTANPSPTEAFSPVPPAPTTPHILSKKEFISQHIPSFNKSVVSCAVFCYILAAINAIISLALLSNPLGLIDSALLAGPALGMHLTKKSGFGIAVFVISLLEVLVTAFISGGESFPYLWIIACINAILPFANAHKKYKQYLKNNSVK